MRRSVPIFAILLLLLPVLLPAQSPPTDIRLRLAQSYERSGDFESAVRVYQELFAADSSDFTLIESLKRCHLKLKQHDEVIALIEHGLRLHPADAGALSQLGGVWLLKGDEAKAAAAWDRAIAVNPGDEMTWRIVGSSMTQVRQFDRAVTTYLAARTALRNPTVFSTDIAYLYGLMQKYAESTREYLAILRQTPSQLAYIQSRLAAFTGNEEGLREASAVVARAASAEPGNVEIRRLRAWLLMEAKDYDAAFDTYREIDRLTRAGGAELFAFAERALNEKSYAAASRAYAAVIEDTPGSRELVRARFGLARSLEELAAEARPAGAGANGTRPDDRKSGDTSAASRYERAQEIYRKIVFDNPNTEIAARALFRLAMIRMEPLADPEGARGHLEKLAAEYRIFLPTAIDAKLALGEVCIRLGEFDRAATIFSEVAGPPPFGGPDRERAALRLAELRFYRHDYKGATAILADLSKNPVSDAANDAIPLRMLIAEYAGEHPGALAAYAEAGLLRARRRDTEALAKLDAAIAADTAGPLADRFALLRGEILSSLGRPDEAIASFGLIIDRMPQSLLRDRAIFRAASVCDLAKGDRPRAIGLYELLLEKHPHSIHAAAARKRIRELRGDSI